MSDNLSIFTFESREIRFVGTAEAPEWVAADILAILYPKAERSSYNKYLDSVPSEWKAKNKILTLGGAQNMATVLEPGLYALLGRSNSPLAVPFQKWLYEEVIPSIRKTGSYTAPNAPTPEPVASQPRPSKPSRLAAIREGLNMLHELRELQELGEIDELTKATLKSGILETLLGNDGLSSPSGSAAPAAMWKGSLRDFLEKVQILLAEGKLGDWNYRVIKKGDDCKVQAIHLPSVWAVLDKQFTVPYTRKIIRSLLEEWGIARRRQRFRLNAETTDTVTRWCYELSEDLLREHSSLTSR